MAVVLLENVGRTYGTFTAVESFDLVVNKGEFLTFLGPSGCGKTTTLRMIAGLERNTSGRILIEDALVSDPATNWFVPPERRQLGMVFQSYAIWPHMTVFENVAYPLRIRRIARSEITRRVNDVLDLIEMRHLADRPAPALSGGQQQRVAIARALVFEPSVLLLDEPLSNLDAKLRTQMGEEFRKLQQRLGITTLYVTHDQDEAMALSDRIVVMQSGKVLQVGSPQEVYHRPESLAVARFVGSPNVLEAHVDAGEEVGGIHRLKVRGEDWEGTASADKNYAHGSRVQVMVRPENLRVSLGDTPADADLAFKGVVSELIFRGATYSVTITAGSLSMHLEVPSATPISVGDPISTYVPHGTAWALDPDSSTATAQAAA